MTQPVITVNSVAYYDVTLTLTAQQAVALRDLVQNDLVSTPDTEPQGIREMRYAIFNALKHVDQ
jgi:hypothetical protein